MTAPTNYAFFADLAAEQPIPEKGTLSRTLLNDDRVKVVLFAFAAGEELSEHTSSLAAILHFVSGSAQLTLGGDTHAVGPHAWVHMPPKLPHSIRAETPTVMLLILLKQATTAS